jgi:O-Antigen ligase
MGALAHPGRRRQTWRAALIIASIAAIAALLAGYKPSLRPPALHPRETALGVAQADVLVDTKDSEIGDLEQATNGNSELAAQLAVKYALYLQSDHVSALLGQAVGLHGKSVSASGPFTLLLGRTNLSSKSTASPNPIEVDGAYRLVLDVDGERPMLSIYSQAPNERDAIAIVDTARALLMQHVLGSPAAAAAAAAAANTVVLRPLGPTVGGVVGSGARWQLMVFVFALVLALGMSLLAARRNRRRGLAVNRAAVLALDRLDEPPSLRSDDWPHTKRVLPWMLAGFLAMLFLVPFDAIDLPINLPLNSSLDRPALVALATLWLLTLAIVSGAARPRLKLTRVHFAVFAFFGLCCLGIALDGHALASMSEVSLVVKKLALLISYIVFFIVVASVIRPREVPRYAVLMVGLGVIVAISTIIEYRLHYNVFYSLWGKVFTVTLPSEFDAPDSLGRLTVFGPTSHPLELAALLAMVLPFAIVGLIDAATRRQRMLYTLAIGLLLAGGVATSRKTSIVAPAAAILLLFAYRPRAVFRSLATLAVVLGVLVHVTSPGALGSVITQLEPGHFDSALTTTDRTERYDAVRPDIISHMLLGRGYESYDPHVYRILDNEYLGLLITTGLLGVLAYLGIFGAMMSAAHRTIRGPDPVRSSWALAAFASVGVIAVASLLFDVLSFPHVPYLLFFIGAMIVTLREPSPALEPARRAVSAPSPLPLGDADRPSGPIRGEDHDDPRLPEPDRAPEPMPVHRQPAPVG